MQEIEKFTRQTIAVEKIEGFGPAPDERAEPIAMGRQTLWGGSGKPPSREVMASAARAARREMMDRIREKKSGAPRSEETADSPRHETRADKPMRPAAPAKPPSPQGNGRPPHRRDRGDRGNRHHGAAGPKSQEHDLDSQPPAHFEDDFQPRANAHLGTQSGVNAFGHKSSGGAGRQPDPTMTSVDLLSRNNRGGGGGGGKRRGGGGKPGGFGGGGGGGGGKRGGGGYGR